MQQCSTRPSNPKRGKEKQRPSSKQCTRCGKELHPHSQCLAKDATCHKCQRSAQCRSKTIDESGLEMAFLDVASTSSSETAWYADIQVGRRKVTFKLDTGAEVTAASQETYKLLQNAPPLHTPQRTLCGPSRKSLQVVGQCQASFHMGGDQANNRCSW